MTQSGPQAARRVRKREVAFAALAFLVFGAGPTVGDVGSCGTEAVPLEERRYARARKILDCRRCRECGLRAPRCERACADREAPEAAFPDTCRPLLHDGEVCLRALDAASCGEYARFVDPVSPSVPSECDFCRVGFPADDAGGTF